MSADLLALENLCLTRDGRAVLDSVTVRVSTGEFVALTGESGAGKTTLVRAITGLDAFAHGAIHVGGVTLSAQSRPSVKVQRELYRRMGVVFQFHHLFANLTVIENVRLALHHVHGHSGAEATRRAVTLLERLGVAHRQGAYPEALSGGEAQRVAIARALAVDPPLLLMDEPTASLDPARRAELGDLLGGLVAEGRTLLVATHDMDFVRARATRILAIANGRLEEVKARPLPGAR